MPVGEKGPMAFTAAPGVKLQGEATPGRPVEDLEAIINAALPDAFDYSVTELGALRAKATEYYQGKPFGNEEKGRSQVVSRDVLAVVQALIPSIMRTFFGTRNRVKYAPTNPSQIEQAEQATKFVNKVVLEVDNSGVKEFYAAAKDALVRYKGVFKVWWEPHDHEVATDYYTGLDKEQLLVLSNDRDLTELRAEEEEVEGAAPPTYRAYATRKANVPGRVRFACVPPEELLVSRDTRTLATSPFVDHCRSLVLGDLVAMGYSRRILLEHAGREELAYNEETLARSLTGVSAEPGPERLAENDRKVTYHEVYLRADMDGDGYAEQLRVTGVGGPRAFSLLHWEPVSEIPFCDLDPDPEPHTFWGQAPGPNVMDIQKIKSALLRAALDGTALSLDPRLAVVEHMVDLDDLLNPEVGGIVRVRAPGQIEPLRFDFNAASVANMLEYMDQVREERTRQSRPSQGLDADSLQSSAKLAVAATLSGAQQQQELIARMFAEGMKQLFRLILHTLVRNSDAVRMMQVNGTWVPVDPRTWSADLGVEVEVGIGVGGPEAEIQALLTRKATQEGVLQLYGPRNPLVSVAQYRDTLVRLEEMAGLQDSDRAWLVPDPNWAPPPPEHPTPEEMIQITAARELELKQQDVWLRDQREREQMRLLDERERQKMAFDYQVKMAELDVEARKQASQDALAQAQAAGVLSAQAQAQAQQEAQQAAMLAEQQSQQAHAAAQQALEAATQPAPPPSPEGAPDGENPLLGA